MKTIESLIIYTKNKTISLTGSDIVQQKKISECNINDIDTILNKNKFIHLTYKLEYEILTEILNTNHITNIMINLDYN
ncbi:MAG: hypothetical protein RR577_04380 [Erysipelotrichales bacterium]